MTAAATIAAPCHTQSHTPSTATTNKVVCVPVFTLPAAARPDRLPPAPKKAHHKRRPAPQPQVRISYVDLMCRDAIKAGHPMAFKAFDPLCKLPNKTVAGTHPAKKPQAKNKDTEGRKPEDEAEGTICIVIDIPAEEPLPGGLPGLTDMPLTPGNISDGGNTGDSNDYTPPPGGLVVTPPSTQPPITPPIIPPIIPPITPPGPGPAVPEPESWALMIIGAGIAGGFLRRQKVKNRVTFSALPVRPDQSCAAQRQGDRGLILPPQP